MLTSVRIASFFFDLDAILITWKSKYFNETAGDIKVKYGIRINFSEIVENHCITVIQISRYFSVEVAYVVELKSNQKRGNFLQNLIYSWSECVRQKSQRGRPPST